MKTLFFSPLFIFILFIANYSKIAFSGTIIKYPTKEIVYSTKEKKLGVNPEEFYKKQCAFCHNSEEMIAPDMKKIKNLYLKKYPQKQEFISAIIQYVKNPSKEKILSPDKDKFIVMPKMPFKEEDIKAVVEYIYEKI